MPVYTSIRILKPSEDSEPTGLEQKWSLRYDFSHDHWTGSLNRPIDDSAT